MQKKPCGNHELLWARGLRPVPYVAFGLPADSAGIKRCESSVRRSFLRLRRAGDAGTCSPLHVAGLLCFLSGVGGEKGRRALPIGCPELPAVLRRKRRAGGGRWAAETLNGAGPSMEAAVAGRQRALLRQVSAALPRPFPHVFSPFPVPSSPSRRLSHRCWAGGWRPPSPGPCCCCPSAPRPSFSSAASSPCARCAGCPVRALPCPARPAFSLRLPQRRVFLAGLVCYCSLLRADCFFPSFRFFR